MMNSNFVNHTKPQKMKIIDIKVYNVAIPFAFSIDHNLKSRGDSDSIIIEIVSDDNISGYGEGAPRLYVTGESSQDLVFIFNESIKNQLLGSDITIPRDIISLINSIPLIEDYPSLNCALEMALLDLLGKERNSSIENIMEFQSEDPINYTGVVPYAEGQKMDKIIGIIKDLEFDEIKLKVGGQKDIENLEKIRHHLGDINLRLDANQAWNYEEAIKKIKCFEAYSIQSIEEPLNENDISRLPELALNVNTVIVLDESLRNLEDAKFWQKLIPREKLMFNIKISKTGGFSKASKIHEYASQNQIDCQLGCNVGETAILSAAGRIFAQTHQIKHLEGSYSRYFMKGDISDHIHEFAKFGKAKRIKGPGFGVKIYKEKLLRHSIGNRP